MECPTWPFPRVDFYIDISDKMETVEKALLSFSAYDKTYARCLARVKKGMAMVRGGQADKVEYAEGFREILRSPNYGKYQSSSFNILRQLLGDRLKINPKAVDTYPPGYVL